MRFLCPKCERPSELYARVDVSSGALVAQCNSCGTLEHGWVTVERASGPRQGVVERTRRSELPVPPEHCPKCITRMGTAARSCPRCGLLKGKFVAKGYELSPTLQELWQAALANYEDLKAHERVARAAFQTGELAQVGRLYSIRLAHDERDTFAAHGRAEVLRLASTGTLQGMVDEEEDRARIWKTVLILLMPLPPVLLLLAALLSKHAHH